MMAPQQALVLAAQGVSSRPLQTWIQDNVVPLVLLGIAIVLLWIGGRGDNAGVARRSVGLVSALSRWASRCPVERPDDRHVPRRPHHRVTLCSSAPTTRSTASTPYGSARRGPRSPGARGT